MDLPVQLFYHAPGQEKKATMRGTLPAVPEVGQFIKLAGQPDSLQVITAIWWMIDPGPHDDFKLKRLCIACTAAHDAVIATYHQLTSELDTQSAARQPTERNALRQIVDT